MISRRSRRSHSPTYAAEAVGPRLRRARAHPGEGCGRKERIAVGSRSTSPIDTPTIGRRGLRPYPPVGQLLRHGHTVPLSVRRPGEIQVPPLVGLTEARRATSRRACTSRFRRHRWSVRTRRHPSGIVIQSPSSGQSLLPGSAIGFTVSLGHAPVQVPALHGVRYATARSQLEGLGFKVVRAADQNSETVPSGEVLSVSPTGTQPYQSAVTVVVSKGPVYVPVPPVVGLGIDAASRAHPGARVALRQRLSLQAGCQGEVHDTSGHFAAAPRHVGEPVLLSTLSTGRATASPRATQRVRGAREGPLQPGT